MSDNYIQNEFKNKQLQVTAKQQNINGNIGNTKK